MQNDHGDPAQVLSRPEASDAVSGIGWRYVLGQLRTHVPVPSLRQAADVAARVVAAAGADADNHLTLDVRPRRVVVSLQTLDVAAVTTRDSALAQRITTAIEQEGLRTDPDVATAESRSAQVVEIAIDALDIPAIRPFWKAILGYVDEAGATGPKDPLVDSLGAAPAIWFQQMDVARPQRNRIHLDVSVPHDEAPRRVQAALDAGGVLVSYAAAPAFWVLADVEGNEACVTTWQGRD
ncbi:VOC family protein [Phytoactinopolyspora mesophila]|uniref:Putative pterin-4-alpha-carbinolamine dehydratase n=1 Tax=Phytoactinopolyspora mesophila TaxID=2650750 RepID=A0A7K3M0P0_9ACTN|nr:VOC family protein [Phytoactinopolyspora mesophila]NDL56597.1 4a-hydroxytetrahydrobiopterin dehydratase [Phytoactinopolyspora mesophila]